jgi:uncharacterized protein (DUF433 family)
MVADEMTTPEVLFALPDLESDDVVEALRYAAAVLTVEESTIGRSV